MVARFKSINPLLYSINTTPGVGGQMGVIYASTAEAVAVINHIYYWGDLHYSTFVGPDRAEDMNPAGRAQRLGIPFSMHSDASVTPVNPLFSMWTATARKTMSGRVLGEAERITVPQALHAVTLGAAYLLGQDDKKGSIKTGKLADFTVLDRNPLDVTSPDELKDIKVLGTVMGGKAFPAGSIGENESAPANKAP